MKRLLFAVLLICLAVPALAGGGRISGVVADENGAPVATAKVEILREIAASRMVTFTTEKGEYVVKNMEPGIYFVRVTLKGALLGEKTAEMMLPVDRTLDFTVESALVESLSQ